MRGALGGCHVVVVGAGLAGLTAARELEREQARVTVLEARDRVGGRIHTVRGMFEDRQHGEAGADLIEGEQTLVLDLARSLGLRPQRILRSGFSYYGPDGSGRNRIWKGPSIWGEAASRLKPHIERYMAAGCRWDSGVAAALGPRSVSDWLRRQRGDTAFRIGMRSIRGFFLADPEDLSLLAVVDQFSSGVPGEDTFHRIPGGNDRLPRKLADTLRAPIALGALVERVERSDRAVRIAYRHDGHEREVMADYAVLAVPTTTLQRVRIVPALPAEQRAAIARLRYGAATRVLLQFDRPFWRRAGRHRAFGTPLPIGAVWDASEHQRGRHAMLMLLAGGRASSECRQILADEGPAGLVDRLRWLGSPSRLTALWHTSWEDDPLSGGGYAVFGPDFDPRLRDWLRRPAGRRTFAGEHTSIQWEGFMNGAIESGRRAAAEIAAQEEAGQL